MLAQLVVAAMAIPSGLPPVEAPRPAANRVSNAKDSAAGQPVPSLPRLSPPLTVLHVLSAGPVNYAENRRWLPKDGPMIEAYWSPILWCFDPHAPVVGPVVGEPCFHYLRWWMRLAAWRKGPTPAQLEAAGRRINRTHWTPPKSEKPPEP